MFSDQTLTIYVVACMMFEAASGQWQHLAALTSSPDDELVRNITIQGTSKINTYPYDFLLTQPVFFEIKKTDAQFKKHVRQILPIRVCNTQEKRVFLKKIN